MATDVEWMSRQLAALLQPGPQRNTLSDPQRTLRPKHRTSETAVL